MATSAVTPVKTSFGSITKATGIAIAVAVVLNIVLYIIAAVAGWLPWTTVMAEDITIAPVIIASIVPSIVGALIYFALTRFLVRERANLVFVIIASLVLIGMAITPITNLVNPGVGVVMILQIMHLVVGLPVMYFLTKTT